MAFDFRLNKRPNGTYMPVPRTASPSRFPSVGMLPLTRDEIIERLKNTASKEEIDELFAEADSYGGK